jgi:hypothetical protein
MNSSMKLAAIVAIAISAGLAGTGCMAEADGADELTDGQDQGATERAGDVEKTGVATEKCCDFFNFPFWSGLIPCCAGLPGFGCNISPFGGGFAGCGGFGCGGFGGGCFGGGFGGCGGCW